MRLSLRAMGDRIVIKPHAGAGMIGGIHIPDSTRDSRNQTFHETVVLSAGKKVRRAKWKANIYISEYFGDEVIVDGETYRIGRERDIVGVMDAFTGAIQPPCDRVLVEVTKDPDWAGCILLPESIRKPVVEGKVFAAGPGNLDKKGNPVPLRVNAGDTVMISKYGTSAIQYAGKKLILIAEGDILAIKP